MHSVPPCAQRIKVIIIAHKSWSKEQDRSTNLPLARNVQVNLLSFVVLHGCARGVCTGSKRRGKSKREGEMCRPVRFSVWSLSWLFFLFDRILFFLILR